MKYPKECPVFVLIRSTNEHWIKGQLVELMDTGPEDENEYYVLGDIPVMHLCSSPHKGWVTRSSLKDMRPLTAAAREMLAIAKARK